MKKTVEVEYVGIADALELVKLVCLANEVDTEFKFDYQRFGIELFESSSYRPQKIKVLERSNETEYVTEDHYSFEFGENENDVTLMNEAKKRLNDFIDKMLHKETTEPC